jgi:DNA polymerase (family 10)
MNNREIAAIFYRIADLMEFRDDNPFKIRSYRAAAETIEATATPLAEMVAAGGAASLRQLPGVGEAISKKIVEILETGSCQFYEELKAEIPLTVLDLLKIEGIGMKTAQILYRQFSITNLDDFEKFVEGDGLQSVPRLGQKTQQRIRASLERLRRNGE